MISTFDKSRLEELLKNFYLAIGIRISVFDDSFNNVTEYPPQLPDICAHIRSCPAGAEACRQCDREAFMRAKNMNRAHTYVCHAGITEAIAPIQLDGGTLGYAVFAHLMPSENYGATVDEICARCRKYNLTEEEVRLHVQKLKTYSREQIYADMKLLEILAEYLQISKTAQWKNDNIPHLIARFIEDNLASPLSCSLLCSHFYISRTKLYQISRQAFNMSIANYIAHRRIERAKELLANSDDGVSDIAAAVGVEDYNYFCKLFRKKTGLTPTQYRRQSKAGQ